MKFRRDITERWIWGPILAQSLPCCVALGESQPLSGQSFL